MWLPHRYWKWSGTGLLLITIIKFKLQLEWCYASLVRLLAFHFTGFTPYIYTCNRLSPGLRAHKRNLAQPFTATIFPRCHWQTSDSPSSLVIVQSNITTIKWRLGRRLLFDSEQKNTNYLYTYTDSVSFRVEISSLLSSHRVDFKKNVQQWSWWRPRHSSWTTGERKRKSYHLITWWWLETQPFIKQIGWAWSKTNRDSDR